MRLIPLTQGQFAQVDDWNYDWLMTWRWYAHKKKHTYYAVRNGSYINGKRQFILMHRLIMNTPDNMECDHEDHNGLNCQEFNLRNASHTQNQINVTPSGASKYLGVTIRQSGKKKGEITAQIQVQGIKLHLGVLKSEIDAARRYDAAARYYFGEFANLNFKL